MEIIKLTGEPAPLEQRNSDTMGLLVETRTRLYNDLLSKFDKAIAQKRSLSLTETQAVSNLEKQFRSVDRAIQKRDKASTVDVSALQQRKATMASFEKRDLVQAVKPVEVRGLDRLNDGTLSGKPVKPAAVQADEYRSAFVAKLNRSANEKQELLLEKEKRSLSAIFGTSGGYSVPTEFASAIFSALADNDPVRKVATVVSTQTGGDYILPTSDDVANEGEIIGENASIGSSVDPTFSNIIFKAYKYSSKLVLAPMELLQDSAYSITDYLKGIVSQRIARIQNRHFTVGTGSSQPSGLVTSATLGKTGGAGQTTSVTYTDLVDLKYSVSSAYRKNAAWMVADSTAKILEKLVAADGKPYWQNPTQPGYPAMLLGHPVIINDRVPAMAANAKSILFGDFSKYLIRDVAVISMVVLHERYSDQGQVGVYAYVRSDGRLLDSAAVKYYANSAT